jgi:alpha-1,6-mannosyltransferase
MKIAEVAEFYAPNGGGVRTYIDRKFELAAEAGHELHVLAPGPSDALEPRPGGSIVWIKAPPIPFDANYHLFWNPRAVHAALDRLAPDLVEASSPWRGAWIAASWPGQAPRALFMHADPVASYPQRWLAPFAGPERVDRLFGAFWKYLSRLSAQFELTVAGSRWLAQRLESNGLGAVAVAPLGIDRRVFSPQRHDPELRRRLLALCGLGPSARLLIGVGRHHAEKRWPMVIEAATRAAAKVELGLLLIGDGVGRTAVERAAAQNPHVRLIAPIRDRGALSAILASADALIHGGDAETFGLVAAEALASGTPVIVPDRGGAAELGAGCAGERYAAGDAEAAGAAIGRLLARPVHALRRAGAEASASVRSDRTHFDDLFSLYETALAESSPTAAKSA